MISTRLSLCLLVLTLALSACRPAATPAAATDDALSTPVSFTRSGGFAGMTDQVEIGVDGAYTVTHNDGSSESGQLTPDQTKELAALLAQSGLFDADHSFTTPGADQFVYTISYNGHTVTTMDGAVPEELEGALDFLTTLIE